MDVSAMGTVAHKECEGGVGVALGDCQNLSKPFRPDLDRSKRCLNPVYLRNK